MYGIHFVHNFKNRVRTLGQNIFMESRFDKVLKLILILDKNWYFFQSLLYKTGAVQPI